MNRGFDKNPFNQTSTTFEINPAWHVRANGKEFRCYDQTGDCLIVPCDTLPIEYCVIELLARSSLSENTLLKLVTENGFNRSDVDLSITELLGSRVLRRVADIEPGCLGQDKFQRYRWQLEHFIQFETPGLSRVDMMHRLQKSHVGIVGLGAQGAQICSLLAACGVGKITLIDGDCVEVSNLPRMPSLFQSDVGRLKVDALAEKVLLHNPDTEVRPIARFVSSLSDAVELSVDLDMLCLCADQPRLAIVEWIGEASLINKVPFIPMAGAWVGPISVPGVSPCHVCISRFLSATMADIEGHIVSSVERPLPPRPAFAPGPASRAAFIANHVLLYLAGCVSHLLSVRFKVDSMGERTLQKLVKYVDCPRCGH